MLRMRTIVIFCAAVITIICSNAPCYSQTPDWNSEFEQGISNYQNGYFDKALPHLEKIANAIQSLGLDGETAALVYFMCGSAAKYKGDMDKSIRYVNLALKQSQITTDVKLQCLVIQLDNFSSESLTKEAESIVSELLSMYKNYKHIDILPSLMGYYLEQGYYDRIISFENDLVNLIVPLAKSEIDTVSNSTTWNSIYMCMGRAYFNLKEYKKAIDYYMKCLDTLTEYTQDNKNTIYSCLAQSYQIIGDKATALKYQKLAIESE